LSQVDVSCIKHYNDKMYFSNIDKTVLAKMLVEELLDRNEHFTGQCHKSVWPLNLWH